MAQQHQRRAHAAIVGAHRGGLAFTNAAPDSTGRITAIDIIDPKPSRAADLARIVQRRFPGIHTAAYEADGREAPRQLADDAVVVATVDTAAATRSLIDSRREGQTVVAQLVGRSPGAAMTAQRLGISAIVRDPFAQAQASLLFTGFASVSEEASSRALTNGGDALTGAILQPLRRAAARRTAGYFRDALERQAISDAPLTFFTSAGEPVPLAVRPSSLETFRQEEDEALEVLDGFETDRIGVIAAVALVSLEMRVDILFVSRSRTDRRRVERVLPLRRPANRFERATIFTD
jgi:hypothetical protein